METSAFLTGLVSRHREGDPDAGRELFAYYAERLGRLAERHLSHRLARRVDEEDVVQSVFRTFFNRLTRGEFQIDSRAQLWQLLVKITVMKARAQGRYHTAAVRDVAAEEPVADDAWLELAATREPGPEEAVILVDQIERLLRGLPPLYCQVLQLRLKGETVAQIATQLGVARQTVYRALDLLQERLREM